MKNAIRNEASLVLVVAVIFSGVAIPVLSGFLEPSQPPGVAAIEIGDPPAGDARPEASEDGPARDTAGQASSGRRERRAQPAEPAPAAPGDDAGEDGDAD